MGFPTVEKFLCCCQLKTGVLIIGALNLVSFHSFIIINFLLLSSLPLSSLQSLSSSLLSTSSPYHHPPLTSKIGALLGVLGSGLSLGGLTVVASGVLDDLDLEDQQLQHV